MRLVEVGHTSTRRRPLAAGLTPLRRVLPVFLLAALVVSPSVAEPYTKIISFDASLSDNGNFWTFSGNSVPAPPYFEGRVTNGLVWVEQLAQRLGIPMPTASLLGGTNYAFAGALAGPGWPNIGGQVDTYLSEYTPDGSELIVMSGSQNNFGAGERDPSVPVAFLIDDVTRMANAGAQNFLLATLAPLGQSPALNGGPNEALFDQLAVDFNAQFVAELDILRTTLSINIDVVDTYALFSDMYTNPQTYGFTNVTDPAFNTLTVVPNPDEYLYWDSGHPTRVAHGFLADAAFDALGSTADANIPEPTTGVLAIAGFACLFGRTRRRRIRV